MTRRTLTSPAHDYSYGQGDVILFEDKNEFGDQSKVPKIEAVCGGLEAKKLQAFSVCNVIEEISDDSDSDIEILDTPHLSKPKKI